MKALRSTRQVLGTCSGSALGQPALGRGKSGKTQPLQQQAGQGGGRESSSPGSAPRGTQRDFGSSTEKEHGQVLRKHSQINTALGNKESEFLEQDAGK